jgi:hypothetical protein
LYDFVDVDEENDSWSESIKLFKRTVLDSVEHDNSVSAMLPSDEMDSEQSVKDSVLGVLARDNDMVDGVLDRI